MSISEVKSVKTTIILAMINAGIWAISIIAMVILSYQAPVVKKLFPILAGGTAVGIALIATVRKSNK